MPDEEDDGVIIRFVLPRGKTEATCSEDLAQAFEKTREKGLNPIWASYDETLRLTPTKVDVFVLDPFEGAAFDHVSQAHLKSTVVGPRCLLTCLLRDEPVPALPYPMYTAAMKDIIVTATGFTKDKKNYIRDKVQLMGGIYSNALHNGVTHLVAEVVRSKKYEAAVNTQVPVMTDDWIKAVWEYGKHENIHATDAQFFRYKCPALMGLNITVSQMNKRDRELLKKSIESHGGIYSGSLDMNTTSILIVAKPEGDKFKYARKWKIPCVSPDWVFDSIEKGCCLHTQAYRVEANGQCSTPTREEDKPLEEVSMCSTILYPNDSVLPGPSTVNETSLMTTLTGDRLHMSKSNNVQQLINILSGCRARCSAPFLEDCTLFLSGFDEQQVLQLSATITAAQGVLASKLTPSVSHMVVGSYIEQHFRTVKEASLSLYKVTLEWIVESMQMGQPVSESDFAFTEPCIPKQPASAPGKHDDSQKGALIMEPDQSKLEDDLLTHYRCMSETTTTTLPDVQLDQSEQPSCSAFEAIFSGKKMCVADFDKETQADYEAWITEAGGQVQLNDVHILIVPVDGSTSSQIKATHVLSNFWLEDCLDQRRLLFPPEYFHYPLAVGSQQNINPADSVVAGMTNYSGRERQFIIRMAERMGMLAQEVFCKRDKNGAKRSTHLICGSPEGSKYTAALKWNIPVVSKDWLVACLQDGQWVCEKPFLVGDSKAFTAGRPWPRQLQPPGRDSITTSPPTVPASDVSRPMPNARLIQLAATPKCVDMDQLRPHRIDLALTETRPAFELMPDSQPSPCPQKAEKPDSMQPFYLKNMKTPDTPYGAFLNAKPSPSSRKIWKRQCDILEQFEKKQADAAPDGERAISGTERKGAEKRDPQLPLAVTSAETHLSDVMRDELQARGMVVLAREKRSFDELMEEKLNKIGKSWKHPAKRIKLTSDLGLNEKDEHGRKAGLLRGVVVFVSEKLHQQKDQLRDLVCSMGGEFRPTYSQDVTHLVFVGTKHDTSRELRLAENENKIVVCPQWLYCCQSEGRKLDATAFPYTFRPPSMKPTITANNSANQPQYQPKVMKELIDLLDRRDPEESPGCRSASKTISLSTCFDHDPAPRTEQPAEQIPLFDSQRGHQAKIVWTGGEDEQRYQSSFEVPENLTQLENLVTSEPGTSPELDKPSQRQMKFMMSSVSEELKEAFFQFLERHQVAYSDWSTCDPEATHIIAQKLNRTEKLLGSIASGKCVLHVSYAERCIEQDTLLPADPFEFGNPDNCFLQFMDPGGLEVKLASAAHRHRLGKLQGHQPLSGMTVIIHTSATRREAFKRLIELGGGQIDTCARPPYTNASGVTHCIAEMAKLPNDTIDFASLAAKGVAVISPLYINEFLISDLPPSIKDYLIEPFKPFWS